MNTYYLSEFKRANASVVISEINEHIVEQRLYEDLLDALLRGGISRAAHDKVISSIDQALLIYQTGEAVNRYHVPLEPILYTVAKAPTMENKPCMWEETRYLPSTRSQMQQLRPLQPLVIDVPDV